MTKDDILSYREMCDAEGVQTLQRGMNYRLHPTHSVILLSQRANAPYRDSISGDGSTLTYEGHDAPRSVGIDPKSIHQPAQTKSGALTQNGKFIRAVEECKKGEKPAEPVRAYEKILDGVWSFKGLFKLQDYSVEFDGARSVFKFKLELTGDEIQYSSAQQLEIVHNRIIPTSVKQEVWKRDGGKCVMCGDNKNLHFDHDLPFSKGGASITSSNIRLLCMKHNLEKSDKII